MIEITPANLRERRNALIDSQLPCERGLLVDLYELVGCEACLSGSALADTLHVGMQLYLRPKNRMNLAAVTDRNEEIGFFPSNPLLLAMLQKNVYCKTFIVYYSAEEFFTSVIIGIYVKTPPKENEF